MENNKTLGEKRVRVDFNITDSGNVNFNKSKTAELINNLEEYKLDTRYNHDSESIRLISLAQTKLEEASMWAVKAFTYNK